MNCVWSYLDSNIIKRFLSVYILFCFTFVDIRLKLQLGIYVSNKNQSLLFVYESFSLYVRL